MLTKTKLAIFFTYILLVATVGVAFAQEGDPAPCEGENVSGTVVAVDEATGVVTVDIGEGVLCTVTLSDGTYAHPIVALLGQYFDDLSAENLVAALEDLETSVVCQDDGSGTVTCDFATEGDPEAQAARVVAVVDNGDGTFTIELEVEGQEEHIFITTEDSELSGGFTGALETLTVMWELSLDGTVLEVGDEIASYHEQGMGFGVLTKLYAMAAASQEACAEEELSGEETCGMTVADLVADLESGMGMGQLFKLYGKPAMVGVGHVRKALKADQAASESDELLSPRGPKDKDKEKGGPPEHAGPKNKDKNKGKGKGSSSETFTPPGWSKKPPKK